LEFKCENHKVYIIIEGKHIPNTII
jgi:hypothetical protein